MCFVQSLVVWLFAKNIAPILSTYTVIGNVTSISIDCSTITINFNVITTSDNATFSVLVVEITTPFCPQLPSDRYAHKVNNVPCYTDMCFFV